MYRIPAVKIQLVKDGTINAAERPYISTPEDAAAIMRPVVELLAEERMYVMLLSTKNRVPHRRGDDPTDDDRGNGVTACSPQAWG